MRLRVSDWHTYRVASRAAHTHMRTDPACARYRPARPGSRLDRASRGITCQRCAANQALERIWTDLHL